MSRYPHSSQQDPPRSMSSHKTSNSNLHRQFQEGHLPVHPENSDWNQLRDSTKQSTGSVSSFKSWTSTEPAYGSKTASYGQQRQQTPSYQQQHGGSPLSQSHRSPPPPRGQSMTSNASSPAGRHRSNSSNSNEPMYYQQHYNEPHHSHTNSYSSNSGYPSRQSGQSPAYGQQSQRQHQYSDLKHLGQRASDQYSMDGSRMGPSATARSGEPYSSGNSEDPPQPFAQGQRQPKAEPAQQQYESPRSSQRAPRRREPAAEETLLPTLDDYEAMLQEMTSPSLGPKGARAGARRSEREAREPRADRAPRQPRRQQQQQSTTDQTATLDALVDEQKPVPRKSDPSFEERRLKRRSSLPSKLKSDPDLFVGLQRRNSGNGHPSPGLPAEPPQLHTLAENPPPATFAHPNHGHQGKRSLNDYAHLPALQEKRFSWENDSVAPRIDLLEAVQTNVLRNSVSQRKGSWQDGDSQQQQQQEMSSAGSRSSMRLSQQSINKPAITGKSHLRLSHTPSQPDTDAGEHLSRQITDNHVQQLAQSEQQLQAHANARSHENSPMRVVEEEPSGSSAPAPPREPRDESGAQTPLPQAHPRPRTPNSRSRPGTPVGGIRPPPGPAPPSASATPPALVRKLSPASGKRPTGAKPSPPNSTNVMLQPFQQGARPRAGSTASVSSMNSFTLDGVLTPPPPSSPLPSLPPHPLHQTPPPTQPLPPITEGGSFIGLGIDHQQPLKTRKMSGGKELLQAFPGDQRLRSLTPSSSREISDLQHKVDALQEERDLLEKKLAALQNSAVDSGQDSSRLEMAAQLENAQNQLVAKDEEIERLRQMHERAQQVHENENESMASEEISRLVQLQSSLQQQLDDSRHEVSHLQGMLADSERSHADEKQAREGLETKVEALAETGDQHEQRKQDHDRAYGELLQEVQALRAEKSHHEDVLEREREAFTARLQQEEAQYRTLQDTVQRLSSKIGRMESQHASELQQIQLDHEEVMDKVVYEHANALTDLTEQHKSDLEAAVEHTRRQCEETFRQERIQLDAREKVLRERLEDQETRNDQLEEELFQVQKRYEDAEREKDVLSRTNRSLERHLSMQHLKDQENEHKMEEMKNENDKLHSLLADLDVAALSSTDEHERTDAERQDHVQAAFEKQQRKWTEQAELMARKLARAEEEARKMTEQNVDLKVALEVAHTQAYTSPAAVHAGLRRPSTSADSARALSALSPPLSV
ncbi:hypothetical protein EC968_009471 [Mortierella alpina]|nr:hypothetical protein EC968_009471 [Mortierella alpina]